MATPPLPQQPDSQGQGGGQLPAHVFNSGRGGNAPGSPQTATGTEPSEKQSQIQVGLSPATQDRIQQPLLDRFLDWGKDRWQELRGAYLVYHMLVWKNILYYSGELWINWDKNRKLYMPITPDDDFTPQPKINKFAPACDAVTSILNMPEVEATPRSEDNIDSHEIAYIANALIHWLRDENGLDGDHESTEDKVTTARQIFVLSGNVFSRVEKKLLGSLPVPIQQTVPMVGAQCPECDSYTKHQPDQAPLQCPTCAGQMNYQMTSGQQPQIDPQSGEPMMQPMDTFFPRIEIVNPVYVLPLGGATGMENCRGLVIAIRKSLDEIYDEFNYEAEADAEFLDSMNQSLETSLNFYYTGYSSYTLQVRDSALVIYFYIPPNKTILFPEGLYGVMINQKGVLAQPWDKVFIEHPITKGDYAKIPTIFFGRTILFDVAPIQEELNAYESLIKLHAMTSAVDPIIIDMNTKVTEVTGRADKIIWWRSIGPGSKEPHRMQHGSLDEGVYQQRQSLEAAIQNITGAVSVYRGEQPGSVNSAAGISQLRGQAEQMFSGPVGNWNNFWCETIRKAVHIGQQCMPAWQLRGIVGEGHDQQIQKFLKCELETIIKYVTTAHGLPRTRDEKRAEMLELFDRGALDISDPNVRQKIYELWGDTGMMQQFNKDATRARAENKMMDQAQMPVFMPEIEDAATHYFIHAERIKSLDFDSLPQQAKVVYLDHTIQTKEFLQGQLAAGGPQSPEGGGDDGGGQGSSGTPGGGPGAGSGGGVAGPGSAAPGQAGPPEGNRHGKHQGAPGGTGKGGAKPAGGAPRNSRVRPPNPRAGQTQVHTGPNGPGSAGARNR